MRTASLVFASGLLLGFALPVAPNRVAALQPSDRPLLQLEVRDASGLPLPNARLELFAYAEGGRFREWLTVTPEILPPGIFLLRFSHDGYRPQVFSVPLTKDIPVSLRVQLQPDSALSVERRGLPQAVPVSAIGLALDTRGGTDIIGSRRVIDRDAYERTHAQGVAEVFRVASVRTSLGSNETGDGWAVDLRNPRTGEVCRPAIMLNGDVTLSLSFSRYQELYRLSEPEAIEFVLDGKAIPHTFRGGFRSNCPVMMGLASRTLGTSRPEGGDERDARARRDGRDRAGNRPRGSVRRRRAIVRRVAAATGSD